MPHFHESNLFLSSSYYSGLLHLFLPFSMFGHSCSVPSLWLPWLLQSTGQVMNNLKRKSTKNKCFIFVPVACFVFYDCPMEMGFVWEGLGYASELLLVEDRYLPVRGRDIPYVWEAKERLSLWSMSVSANRYDRYCYIDSQVAEKGHTGEKAQSRKETKNQKAANIKWNEDSKQQKGRNVSWRLHACICKQRYLKGWWVLFINWEYTHGLSSVWGHSAWMSLHRPLTGWILAWRFLASVHFQINVWKCYFLL